MSAKEMWGAERCSLCEEQLTIHDTDVAEMVDPKSNPTHPQYDPSFSREHKIVHFMCGEQAGMVLA